MSESAKADPVQVLSVLKSWLAAMEVARQNTTPHEVLDLIDKIEAMYAPVDKPSGEIKELEFRYPVEASEFWIG